MPTYKYKCNNPDCSEEFEIVQKITDERIKICPYCESKEYEVSTVLQPTMTIFKGDGWPDKS